METQILIWGDENTSKMQLRSSVVMQLPMCKLRETNNAIFEGTRKYG
jgi:hypothetical protein